MTRSELAQKNFILRRQVRALRAQLDQSHDWSGTRLGLPLANFNYLQAAKDIEKKYGIDLGGATA